MIFGFFMLIVFINVILSGFSSTEKGITKSTKDRTALSANLCTDIGSYYYDDLDWIYDSSTLVNGMRYFYQTTGVQPFLYITDNIAGDYSGNYSISVQNDYGDQIYDSLFNDEGHILVIFCEYRDSEYVCFTTAGADATSVMDSEAREILLDYIDNYYYSDYEDEEYFARAFRQSADRIMNKTSAGGNTRITLNLMPFIVIFIVLIIVIVNIIKDRKRKAQQMAANGGYGNNGTYGANGANDYYDLTAQSQPTQNQYGQTQYGQNQYGQTQYGQNQYGQTQYGQNQYGQTQYDQTQSPYQSSYNGNNYNNNNNNGF